MNRDEYLAAALQATTDRGEKYGNAADNFERIAVLWTAILGYEVTKAHVAQMMIALKLARLCATPDHADSWVDIAGYAALGGEVMDEAAVDR